MFSHALHQNVAQKWFQILIKDVVYSMRPIKQSHLTLFYDRAAEDWANLEISGEIRNQTRQRRVLPLNIWPCQRIWPTRQVLMNGVNFSTDHEYQRNFRQSLRWDRYFPLCGGICIELSSFLPFGRLHCWECCGPVAYMILVGHCVFFYLHRLHCWRHHKLSGSTGCSLWSCMQKKGCWRKFFSVFWVFTTVSPRDPADQVRSVAVNG